MLRLQSSARTIAARIVLGVGGGTVAGACLTAAYAHSDQGAGLRRKARFWYKVGPVVLDYYWKTAESSPYVRYRDWTTASSSDDAPRGADDDGESLSSEDIIISKREQEEEILQKLHSTHAPEIYQVLLELRGLYIKLGQVLSVTALPIPETYREYFRTLQGDVPGWEDYESVVKPLLEKEFGGRKVEDVFDFIDPIPCGAASIGQAHRARLKKKSSSFSSSSSNDDDDDENGGENGDSRRGEEVIVKVQYPDAAWQVPADIQCVGDFMKVCVWAGVVDESSAKLSYDEFARQFLSELDYARECANLKEIYDSSLDPAAPYVGRNVVIPRVYDDLCTERVITMTYLPGPKLEEEARRQLAMLGIDTSKGIGGVIRDASNGAAADPTEARSGGGLISRSSGPSSSSWRMRASTIAGRYLGIDSVVWAVRFYHRLLLWSRAAAAASIRAVPRGCSAVLLPPRWLSWADSLRVLAEQEATGLSRAGEWLDALFDVHGHQIFNLGLFNADPHPGNILVVKEGGEGGGRRGIGDDDSNGVTAKSAAGNKLGLIDYGQCKRLTPREQVQIARLVLAVANDEPDESIANAFRDLGIATENDSTSFMAELGRLMFGPLRSEHMDRGWHRELHARDRIVYFPRQLSMVYRTSLLLRGLGVSLQLNCAVGDQWRRHAQKAVDRSPRLAEEVGEAEADVLTTDRRQRQPFASLPLRS